MNNRMKSLALALIAITFADRGTRIAMGLCHQQSDHSSKSRHRTADPDPWRRFV